MPAERAWGKAGPQTVDSVSSALGLDPWDAPYPPPKGGQGVSMRNHPGARGKPEGRLPVSRTSSRGGGGSGKRLLPSSLAPPPNSSAHAILRTQIMPAVAVAHISFQKHPALRGPAQPPSLARWPLCQVGASCLLCLPHPAGHTDSGHGQ